MKLRSIASFAAFLGMIVALVGYVASLGIRIAPPEHRTKLSMDVADISNIVVDSTVLLRGIPVGKVTRIDTSIATATIHFYIDQQYRVPVNSDVRLENLSALGEAYIEFDPRSSSGPMLHDGQRIATESVKRPASISELATSVVRVLNQLAPDQLSRVIGEVDAGLPDEDSVLPNLGRASVLLRNTTADFKGRGQDVLSNLQVLLKDAGWLGPSLAATTTPVREVGLWAHSFWNRTLNDVLRTEEPASVQRFHKLVNRIQSFLDNRGPDIRTLTEPLLANVQAIAAAAGSIDSGQILTNLLASVPEDGAIELHVKAPEG